MTISSITIQNFRCFEINKFELNDLTYICGENGSGKTSILEAISLINGGSSFRTKTMENLIKDGLGLFEIMADTAYGNVFIQHDFHKKTLEFNNQKIAVSSLKKKFCPIVFSPQYELSLATATATRTFFDKLASHLFPEHEKLLNKCKELSSERLKILALSNNDTWLSTVEEQISHILTIILYNRYLLLEKINQFCSEINLKSSARLSNKYTQLFDEKKPFIYIEKQITEDLKNTRKIDKISNRSSISINTVEYNIIFNGKNIEFTSSGQQKLIGAIYALGVAFEKQKSSQGTIVLLDDITAKIDGNNQQYLEEVILHTNCQTIISTIEKPNSAKHYIILQNQAI